MINSDLRTSVCVLVNLLSTPKKGLKMVEKFMEFKFNAVGLRKIHVIQLQEMSWSVGRNPASEF